jgi:hypothetical protein
VQQTGFMKTIKKLVLLSMFVLVSALLHAQRGFEFAPFIQGQNTWLLNQADNDAGGELDFKATWNLAYGVMLGYGFHDRHGIRAGVYLSNQGQNYITDDVFERLPTTKYYTQSQYLQIPVLYRYNGRLDLNNSAFILEAGPQFGMLQWAKATEVLVDNNYDKAFLLPEYDCTQCYNSMDIQARLGLGILARFSTKLHMNAMLNFNYSLQDIETDAGKRTPDRPVTRNGVVGLNVGLFLLLGGPDMALKLPKDRGL